MMSFARLEVLWEQISGDAKRGVSLLHSARKRLLTFTAVLTFFVALVWVSLTGPSLFAERPLAALLCGVVPFLFLPFPFAVVRTSIDLDVAAWAYLGTLYCVVTLTAAALGGAVATTSFFLMLVPLLATLLLGIGAGVVWVGLIALTYLALHLGRAALPAPAFEVLGAAPDYWLNANEVSLWNAIMMALLGLAASFSVANFRAVVSKSSALLSEAGRKTQDALEARAVAEEVSLSRAELMANVSHELRTPLNAIIGYSELLIETAEDRGDASLAADNRRVLEAAAKLQSMVNDILKLSAIDTGRTKLELDEVDIDRLAQDAVAAMMPSAEAKANNLTFTGAAGRAIGHTDGVKLDHCMRTLIAHAVSFTEAGRISVRLSRQSGRPGVEGAHFCFEVEDNGVAADQKTIDALFEPFAHTGDAKVPRFAGPNIDLALCRRFARLMGGDLVATLSPSGGVHFTLTAPLQAPGQAQAFAVMVQT